MAEDLGFRVGGLGFRFWPSDVRYILVIAILGRKGIITLDITI